MSNRYYGSLILLKKDYNLPEVRKVVDEERQLDIGSENDDIIVLSSYEATNGKFDELEDALKLIAIPFDRFSSSCDENMPEKRVYRPQTDQHPEIDDVFVYTIDEEVFVLADDIENILDDVGSAAVKIKRLKRLLLNKNDKKNPIEDEIQSKDEFGPVIECLIQTECILKKADEENNRNVAAK